MNEKNGAKADGDFGTERAAGEPAGTTAPEQATPEKATPNKAAPDRIAPDKTTSEKTTSEKTEAEQAVPGRANASARGADRNPDRDADERQGEDEEGPRDPADGRTDTDVEDNGAAISASSGSTAPNAKATSGSPAPDTKATSGSTRPDSTLSSGSPAPDAKARPGSTTPDAKASSAATAPDSKASSAGTSPAITPAPEGTAPASPSASKAVAEGREAPSAAPSARRESDSERTSEFVALKPDLPTVSTSRPAAWRPAPSWSAVASGEEPKGSEKPEEPEEPERTREFGAPPAAATDDRTMALTRPAASAGTTPTGTSSAGTASADAPGPGGPAGPPPPLDLLAQLTNTPPKPETPARTVARRVKIWGTLAVLLAIVVVAVQALRPLPTPTLKLTIASSHTANGAALSLPWPTEGQAVVDINGLGRMGSYGEMKPLPIGSVAKVMTTYLILRDHPLKPGAKGPLVPVDQKAQDDYTNGVTEKESVVEVKAGQQVPELEALQAVMLPSANNVARLLARWDASTEEAFIKKMNDTAKSFGMTNTTYTDASGLKESTVSTAEDQVNLAKRAMADPVFRQIAKLPSYTSTTTSGGSTVETSRTQYNFNKLVPLYGVVGIKTGSTTKAGGNLLFAAETPVGDTKQLVVGAVFGQHKPSIIETATTASKNLILAADKALRNETVVKKGDVVGRVDDGLGGTVPVVADKDLAVPIWPGASVEIKLTDGGQKLPHTAKAGTAVGILSVGGGIGEVKVPVSLKDDLTEPSLGAKVTRLG